MGSSGRPLFDLNELPDEDELDFPSNSNCDDLQPAIDSVVRTDHSPSILSNPGAVAGHPEQPCSGVSFTAQDNSNSSGASLSHSSTVAPFQPGQHPLSCFKPFSVFQPATKPQVAHRPSADNSVPAKESAPILRVFPSNLENCKPKVVPVISVSVALTATAGKEGGGEVAETVARLPKISPSEDEDRKNAVSGKVKPTADNLPAEVNEAGHDHNTARILEDCNKPSLEASGKLNSDGFIKLVADNNKESPAETPVPSNMVSLQENATVDDQIVQKPIQPNQQQSLESKLPPVLGKRRSDLKDAMLGKKRNRQTVFIDIHEVKQAPPLKTPTRRSVASLQLRAAKDSCPRTQAGEISAQQANVAIAKDNVAISKDSVSTQELKKEPSPTEGLSRSNSIKQSNAEDRQRQFAKPLGRRHVVPLATAPPVANKPDERQPNPPQRPILVKKGPPNYRKQTSSANFYSSPDSSKERLHREATCDRLWRRAPGEAELRRVPGSFESVEEYVRVFEPLLFEECRAQLLNTWEELSDSVSKDAHMPVSIKVVERRERGWYDAVLIPLDPQAKLNFKEGDVAVLSTPKPSSVGGRSKKTANGDTPESAVDSEMSSRIAGIVRRYFPVDTRDLPGAVLHFHLGESATDAATEKMFEKFQIKTIVWYLTVLGSLATTQREYLALNSFHRLHTPMINSILQPKPDLFPRYENGPPPAMPDCFTSSFSDYLHRTFNDPQLAAIKWAAMHTADETNNSSTGSGKRQEPWSFSLVQGPPGTGKTHTVWGMLNVIHLVQYQRYYAALLRKLAPGSVKATDDNATRSSSSSSSSSAFDGSCSIDEVLQKMDESLARVLPKLCPKPRMLVCAPSNAATDELLTRVLERGFIDGEMKVYRPDVARVGIDSQSRAAQAVSVERRSEQLLSMGRDEVVRWIQQLRGREAGLSQRITLLQRELGIAAAAIRSQGTLGVDPEVLVARDQSRDSRLQELARIVEERDKVLVEMSRMLITESRFRSGSSFSLDDARNKLEVSFAKEAEVVFTTVSSSGRRLFNSLAHSFDMVVIDEAAQASEVAVLPPLSLGAARCVLVGDPQQLPATVISRAADTLQYSRSLFERFQQAGCPTLLLSVQYRMHPQIRDFPSRYFYQARLLDSDTIKSAPDEVYHKDPLLRPYLFYDISHGRESHRGGSVSYQNVLEAQFAARLYEYLQSSLKAASLPKVTVGVITPYKLQLKCLQQEFEPVLSSEPESKGGVYINTVDAFQGQERDVIIMSCVRASSHGVGFVADIRRMNVALTRARRALWVMGNALALAQSEDWAALIADAKERNCFVSMENAAVKALMNLKSSNVSSSQGRSSGGILRLPKPHGFPRGGGYQSSQSDACASQSRGGGPDKQQPTGLKLQQQGSATEDYKNEKR